MLLLLIFPQCKIENKLFIDSSNYSPRWGSTQTSPCSFWSVVHMSGKLVLPAPHLADPWSSFRSQLSVMKKVVLDLLSAVSALQDTVPFFKPYHHVMIIHSFVWLFNVHPLLLMVGCTRVETILELLTTLCLLPRMVLACSPHLIKIYWMSKKTNETTSKELYSMETRTAAKPSTQIDSNLLIGPFLALR